jgi:hypothetical protein
MSQYVTDHHYLIPEERLTEEAWSLQSDAEAALFSKIMQRGQPLGEYVEGKMFYGIKTGLNEAFVIDATQYLTLIKADSGNEKLVHHFLGGREIRRYEIDDVDQSIIAIPCGYTRSLTSVESGRSTIDEAEAWAWLEKSHRAIASHLRPFSEALRKRDDQGDFWWELRPCEYYSEFESSKIIFPDICKGPRFYLDESGSYIANTAYCLGTDDRYLLGFLNSRLFWFAISNISIPFGVRAGKFRYRLIYQYMEKVPVRVIDPANKADNDAREKIVSLVDQMMSLHKLRSGIKTPHEQTATDRQISAIDSQIDRLVYDLYGLTDEEIELVESTV